MNLLDRKGRIVFNVVLLNLEYDDMIKIEIIEIFFSLKDINVFCWDKINVFVFSIVILYVKYNNKILKWILDYYLCDYFLYECIKEKNSEKEKIWVL